jgi:hypothetical protein
MLFGAGVRGDTTVGGYRTNFAGFGVDRESFELSEDAPLLEARDLGATLMALAGANPAREVPDGTPIAPVLA